MQAIGHTYPKFGFCLTAGHRKRTHGSHARQRAVAPEHGGGREYDIEAEFMDELGPLPKACPAEDNAGKPTPFTVAALLLIVHDCETTASNNSFLSANICSSKPDQQCMEYLHVSECPDSIST